MSPTTRASESQLASVENHLSAVVDSTSTKLLLPAHLARQLSCLAEISYPFESCGLLIGHALGNCGVVEQVVYVDPPGDRSGRQIPSPEVVLEARESLSGSGLEVVGIWNALPCCSEIAAEARAEELMEGISFLTVSIPALGSARFRSWRRSGGLLFEEKLN